MEKLKNLYNSIFHKSPNIPGIEYNNETKKYKVELTTENGTFPVGEYKNLKEAKRALGIASASVNVMMSNMKNLKKVIDKPLQKQHKQITPKKIPEKKSNGQYSLHKGVSFNTRRIKWFSYCNINGKRNLLGFYDTEEEAYHARCEFLKENPKPMTIDKGINYNKSQKRWNARSFENGEQIWLGSYKTKEEAQTALKNYKEKNIIPETKNANGKGSISFYKRENRYVVRVFINNKRRVIGYFKNKEEAQEILNTFWNDFNKIPSKIDVRKKQYIPKIILNGKTRKIGTFYTRKEAENSIKEWKFDYIKDNQTATSELIEKYSYKDIDIEKTFSKQITPYHNIKIDEKGNLYTIHSNRKLKFNFYDVMSIENKLNSFKILNDKNYQILKDSYSNFSKTILNRIIVTIQANGFDELKKEFLNLTKNTMKFTAKNNMLYVNDEATSLKFEDVDLIIQNMVNSNNKDDSIRKLQKQYTNILPRFIQTIGYNYNNPNLSFVMKNYYDNKKSKSTGFLENNTEKRREFIKSY